MNTKIMMVVFAFSMASIHAQEADSLPPESQKLVDQLFEWELDKQATLQAEIKAKRKAVIQLLQRHMAEATKSGNLDSALAIRSKIANLQSLTATLGDPLPESATEEGSLAEWLPGKKYQFKGKSGSVILSFQKSSVDWQLGSKTPERREYRITGQNELFVFGNEVYQVTLKKGFKTGTLKSSKGEYDLTIFEDN